MGPQQSFYRFTPRAAIILKILQVSASGVSTLFLVVMMVSSAGAVPLLSIGSNANYSLSATVQAAQSCYAAPVSYNQTACGPYQPMALVSIYDDGVCALNSPACQFWPPSLTVAPGTTVMWFNYGKMQHTVSSSATAPYPNSGLLAPDASYSYTFTNVGNYSYHCIIHPWMHGVVTVSTSAYSPPTPIYSPYMPAISLDGSISWNTIGLDNNVAVLNVSHQVSIVASVGPASFTPVTETGSFSQSIDLATRVESSGTATSVILGLVQRMLTYYPGYYGYGYPNVLGQLASSQKTVYTFWWVNGPLANGSPVQILTGYSSVTGNEVVNLGPGNNRNAWIVESGLSQSLSTTSPPVISSGGSTDTSFRLEMKFDYDQASDLLLKSNTVVSLSSARTQEYNPGDSLCGQSGCFPVSDHVTVSHHMSATIPVSLQLTTTNLDLSKRTPPGSIGNGQSSTGGSGGTSRAPSLPDAMTIWIYAGIGVVGAGLGGTLAWWLLRRNRSPGSDVQPQPPPTIGPTAVP